MEQSNALTKLLEAADLLGMLEDLTNPQTVSKLSPASLAGMRITMRSARELVLNAHDKLASSLVASSVSRGNQDSNGVQGQTRISLPQQRDLRTSIEKFVDK